ncbi:MAG: GAF domain-containing protein [Oscillospiraceae bacterium]|nr:GAF domain-containing protein [Oscillospiraceae bacterium]
MTYEQMRRVLEISLDLSAERDREKLLSKILDTAMDITGCDAGTLYLIESDGLHFVRMVTRSMKVRQGGHAAPITLPPVPLEPEYVCSRAVLNGCMINVPDVRSDKRFDFSGALRYDEMTGYSTKTMLVVPMSDDRGEIIGVAQLINAQDAQGNVIPFDSGMEVAVQALASQAAISITNMRYSEQIVSLLDSLVGALSAAIDERTPYNANHTRNMVRYAAAFLDWLDASSNEWKFDGDRRRTFLLSVWLHDVGKMVVPLEVMNKETRLGPLLGKVLERFREIGLLARIDELEGRLDAEEAEKLRTRLKEGAGLVEKANAAGFLTDETLDDIKKLAAETYRDENGRELPWLTADELEALSVRKGTLTGPEREIMENHAAVTAKILSHVAFPARYADVPRWAAEHHELLNGKGYPKGLKADEIPREVRLLTVLDVFDALTARDRPYKPPMPADKAFEVLKNMVREGGIDGEILALFEQSGAWKEIGQ